MLSVIAGCASVDSTGTQSKSAYGYIHDLKENGCDQLSPIGRQIIIAYIKAKVPDYPKNGICNPDWVSDVLVNILETDDA
jgi:hypothetical protein